MDRISFCNIYAVQQDTQSVLMSEFIHHVCQLDMFRTSSGAFLQAVFTHLVCGNKRTTRHVQPLRSCRKNIKYFRNLFIYSSVEKVYYYDLWKKLLFSDLLVDDRLQNWIADLLEHWLQQSVPLHKCNGFVPESQQPAC